MSTLYPVSVGGGDGRTVIAEDILHSDDPTAPLANRMSPLKRRGPVVWSGSPESGWSGLGQHFLRSAPLPNARSGGLYVGGRGAESDGYGSDDSGSGIFLRRDRFREAAPPNGVVYTMSGVYTCQYQDVGPVTDGAVTYTAMAGDALTFYFDTQSYSNGSDIDRGFYRVAWTGKTAQWSIRNNAGNFVPISATNVDTHVVEYANARIGGNQNKESAGYFAVSIVVYPTNPVDPSVGMGTYGHFQIAGRSWDLRLLNAGYSQNAPQAGDQGNTFAGGLNIGLGISNQLASLWGGITIERLELTVGDELT